MHTIRTADSPRKLSFFSKKLVHKVSTGHLSKIPSVDSVDSRSLSRQTNRSAGQFTMTEERQLASPAVTNDTSPSSVNFDSEEETYIGEPLVQDFAADNIPEAFRPYSSKKSSGSESEMSSDEESTHQVAMLDAPKKAGGAQPKRRQVPMKAPLLIWSQLVLTVLVASAKKRLSPYPRSRHVISQLTRLRLQRQYLATKVLQTPPRLTRQVLLQFTLYRHYKRRAI